MYELIDQITTWMPATVLVFIRIASMMSLMPIFGYATVSMRIRLVLSVMLTLIIAPLVGAEFHVHYTSRIALAADVMREMLVGFIIGWGARVLFEAFTMAGTFVGFQIGLAMMNVIDPSTQTNQSLIGNFWMLIITIFFIVTNSDHFLIETFFNNFKIIPLAGAHIRPVVGEELIGTISTLFDLALRFVAPMMILILMTDVAIAFMARVMPQLNIFFVSLPLKLVVGLYMLLVSLKIFQSMFGYFEQNVELIVLNLMHGMRGI